MILAANSTINKSYFIALFLLFFSSMSAKAETINRQAYKVCKKNEAAYWDGFSADCCDTTTHKLVKNYINGKKETFYACCPLQESYTNNTYKEWNGEQVLYKTNKGSAYSVSSAANGNCCGGYTSETETTYYSDGKNINEEFNHSYTYDVKENGGIYYCAKDWTTDWKQFADGSVTSSYTNTGYYTESNQYCTEMITSSGGPPKQCCTATKDDPAKGTCEYIFS